MGKELLYQNTMRASLIALRYQYGTAGANSLKKKSLANVPTYCNNVHYISKIVIITALTVQYYTVVFQRVVVLSLYSMYSRYKIHICRYSMMYTNTVYTVSNRLEGPIGGPIYGCIIQYADRS